MKKRNQKQLRIILPAAVLTVLAILAIRQVPGSSSHTQGEPAALTQSPAAGLADTSADSLAALPGEAEDAGPGRDTAEGSTPGDNGAETTGTEAPPEAQKASFLPDYSSAPLLNTTAIRCLTMEVGADETEVRFNWLSPSFQGGQIRLTNAASGETSVFPASWSASSTVPGYYVNKVTVTGLVPGASYTYQAGNDEAWSPEYSFTCADAAGDTMTFLVTSDAQIGQSEMEEASVTAERWDSVLTRLSSYVPEASFLFHLGDQVADYGSSAEYELFLEHLALYRLPLAPVTGNHDVPNEYSMEANGHPAGPYFYEHFNVPNRSSTGQSQFDQDGNYHFLRGNVLFIVLNSLTVQGSEAQEQYVAQTAAAYPDVRWRILVQHYAPYPGAANSFTDCAEYLARIAWDNDIDLILNGHDHVYSRTAFVNGLCETLAGYPYENGATAINPEGTMYVTCSTSSGCLYHEAEGEMRIVYQGQPYAPMALRIDVTDTELHMRAYVVDTWTVCDEYTIRKE